MVSKAREDLPLPLRPVITTSLFLGMVTSIFFRVVYPRAQHFQHFGGLHNNFVSP
jgi:hypothetical protein